MGWQGGGRRTILPGSHLSGTGGVAMCGAKHESVDKIAYDPQHVECEDCRLSPTWQEFSEMTSPLSLKILYAVFRNVSSDICFDSPVSKHILYQAFIKQTHGLTRSAVLKSLQSAFHDEAERMLVKKGKIGRRLRSEQRSALKSKNSGAEQYGRNDHHQESA